ncbi:MAG: penicillin-binding transpeptidase domain-containing protein [Eubacteriales bacterium]
MFNWIKERFIFILDKREIILILTIFSLFIVLIMQCFKLQIVDGEMYLEETTMLIQKTREVSGTRGNIYDCNGELIAYNELVYCVTIEDNGEYDTTSEKNIAINGVISEIIDIVESNEDSMISDFGITLDENEEYAYVATTDTARLRFIADIYGQSSSSNLTEEQTAMTAEEIIEYLCGSSKFGIDTDSLSKEEVLKYVNIRYAMSLNSYSKYIATTVAENVSDGTVATIMENMSELQGVNISEDTIRCYNDAIYYSSMIGYTGVISEDEYQAYQEAGLTDYTKTDIVGKSGLEQYFDTELQGTKGEELIYTDNLGNIIESITTEEASAGSDVYLTVDSELMEAAYNIIEEKLAAILYAKIQNVLTYDASLAEDTSDIIIPIGDVYNAFFANMILTVGDFDDEDAGDYEKEILALYTNRYEQETTDILDYLANEDASSLNTLSSEQQAYITYVVSTLLSTDASVILTSSIDTSNETYTDWKSGDINLYTYINFLISENCIDTSLLQNYMDTESSYSNSSQTFDALYNYIETKLVTNAGYRKLIYQYMITTSELSGSLICLAAFDQGVFEYDQDEIDGLISGSITAYSFLMDKIYNIELTAGQLGLEPCSASAVVTDPDTGDVLALISYPGYDVNLLANTIDTEYYSKLSQDLSSPFYNHATYEKTAPGSTFKMVTAIAALEEGVISTDTVISCSGIFEKVSPSAKCWIYPYSHGSMNVITALQNSCNSFFYEVSYRLSLTNKSVIGTDDKYGSTTYDYYSSDLGTSVLAEYAGMLGLNTTTGIEIGEAQPQISDTSSVPSAIGQGTNNYTTTQLARYVSAIANGGTVYDLTLVDSVVDVDGTIILEQEPVVYNEITDVADSTWDAVQTGMELVIENHSSFTNLPDGVTMAGKTGTAEQSSLNPDHALFTGYAPVDDPEITVTVRIANGYKSSYAAEIARDIMLYYLDAVDEDEIITGTASELGTSTAGD